MSITKLNEIERTEALATLPAWTLDAGRDGIRRTLVFSDFVTAFGFMTQVALVAEKSDHHPEWSNVWNRVEILLTTHDADGLSRRDVEMAHVIDRIATALGAA